MSKVIDAKNWSLTPAPDGRRYSKYPDGNLPSTPASWNLPATINVPAGTSVGVRQYTADADGWTIAVTGLATGLTYNSGTESIDAADTTAASGAATFTLSKTGETDVVDTTTVALVAADDRQDILMSALWDSEYPSYTKNEEELSWAAANKSNCGIMVRKISDSIFDTSAYPAIDGLAHVEIATAAEAGLASDHVVPGNTRAMVCTLYSWHPDSSHPYVPYSDWHNPLRSPPGVYEGGSYVGSNARLSRMDCMAHSYPFQTMSQPSFQSGRFSTSLGYTDEWWYGCSVWFPDDFIFDTGAAANLTLFSCGLSPPVSQWVMLMPSLALNSDPKLRVAIRNYNSHGQNVSATKINNTINGTEGLTLTPGMQAAWRGKRVYFVFNWKADPPPYSTSTPLPSNRTGFFRAWYNVHGDNPVKIFDEQNILFGYDNTYPQASSHDFLWFRHPNIYKSEWHKRDDNNVTNSAAFSTSTRMLPTSADALAGLSWDKLTLGFDSWRIGGSNSNFKSVHPMMQEEPV